MKLTLLSWLVSVSVATVLAFAMGSFYGSLHDSGSILGSFYGSGRDSGSTVRNCPETSCNCPDVCPELNLQTVAPFGVPIHEAPLSSQAENVERLKKWFKEQGGTIHDNVSIVAISGGFGLGGGVGLFATGPVRNSEVIVHAPEHLQLAFNYAVLALMDELGRAFRSGRGTISTRLLADTLGFTQNGDLTPFSEMTSNMLASAVALMIMIHEHDMAHFFYPYFAYLPKTCQMSLCWDQERVEKVFSPKMAKEIFDLQEEFKKVATRLGINPAEFLIKVSVVKSRYWTSGNSGRVMVPVADMFNHDPLASGSDFLDIGDGEIGGSTVSQKGSSEKGDQLFLSYGPKHNGELMKSFSFIIEKNKRDTCNSLQTYFTNQFIRENVTLPESIKCEI